MARPSTPSSSAAAAAVPTAQEAWEFDVSGWLVVHRVLSPAELQRFAPGGAGRAGLEAPAAATGLSPADDPLHRNETLRRYLTGLCFEAQEYHLPGQPAYKLDSPLQRLRPAAGEGRLQVGGGRRLGYQCAQGVRYCHGVRAIWALGGGQAGLSVVSGSHKPGLPPPAAVLGDGGTRFADDLQITTVPALAAGDLLLVCSGLLHCIRPVAAGADPDEQQLLAGSEYIGAMVRHGPAVRAAALAAEVRSPPAKCHKSAARALPASVLAPHRTARLTSTTRLLIAVGETFTLQTPLLHPY